MSLKDVIFKMSRHLIETCESSEDLRFKTTRFSPEAQAWCAKSSAHLAASGWLTHCSLELMLTMIFLQEDRPVSKQAYSKARPNLNPNM